uniref:Ubiquitin n=1 Tax=Rhizophora mucronata TaxID=61149 RepID=A0A2P2JU34_RHIMU
MKHRATLDIVVSSCLVISKLLASINKPLLHRGNSFFLLNSFLDSVNGISWFYVNFDFFSSKGLHFDHSSTPESQDQVKS